MGEVESSAADPFGDAQASARFSRRHLSVPYRYGKLARTNANRGRIGQLGNSRLYNRLEDSGLCDTAFMGNEQRGRDACGSESWGREAVESRAFGLGDRFQQHGVSWNCQDYLCCLRRRLDRYLYA